MAAGRGVEGVKLTVSIVLQADKACRGDNRQVVVYVDCFAKLMRFHKESVDQVRCLLDSRRMCRGRSFEVLSSGLKSLLLL